MNVKELAETYEEYIISKRRYFHQHPELPFEEKNTTEALKDELLEMGWEVMTFPNFYGLTATLQGAQNGPVVMLRADIDALPVTEHTGLPYASAVPGKMHACGHDCHMAMLLGAAKILMDKRSELKGTVKLLFQAAEESCHGSGYYVDNGILDGVDAIFGLHIWGTLDAPYFALRKGGCMASCDNFKITINGQSSHGSAPHLGHDAIVAAAATVMNLQTFVSRRNDPQNAMVVTVGTIRGGEAFNILSNQAVLEGTARTYSREVQRTLEQELNQIVQGTAAALGCEATFEYEHCFPAIFNEDPNINKIVEEAAIKLYGKDCIREMDPLMSSDDFSRFLQLVPGYYGYIGALNPAVGAAYPNHNDKFTADESALKRGAALYAQFALDYTAS